MSISLEDIQAWLKKELNFFRIHLLFFLFVPLLTAVIFWAVNGQFHIAFIDCLFLCYSALTVTGLSTVNLSSCTVLQQAILYVLMLLGNVTTVAWVMVLIRIRYFKQRLEEKIRVDNRKKRIGARLLTYVRKLPGVAFAAPQIFVSGTPEDVSKGVNNGHDRSRIRAEEGIGAALVGGGSADIGMGILLGASPHSPTPANLQEGAEKTDMLGLNTQYHTSSSMYTGQKQAETESPRNSVEFAPGASRVLVEDVHSFTSSPRSGFAGLPSPTSPTSLRGDGRSLHIVYGPQNIRRRPGVPIPRRRQTVVQPPLQPSNDELGLRSKDRGHGGFPGPFQLSAKLVRSYFPEFHRFVVKHLEVQPPQRHGQVDTETGKPTGKGFKGLVGEFENLVIGRNSDFNTEELTDEELERLGGLEYRALVKLSYLVFFYFWGTQLLSFILIAPWLSISHTYNSVFDNQFRMVNKSWFAWFQVMGAYTGGGMSLVDTGMVPFQRAYLMIFSLIFVILAGNHGLPIFLRLIIWIWTKFVRDDSVSDKTLHFLLDHPRRCFLYLFPSHVTWFLLATLLFFTAIEWSSFIVLDIGLEVTQSLPPGTRAVAGLFQSFAVRASGFSIVNLSDIAPSFQFLCVIMMYIAVYPVALSIRSTNNKMEWDIRYEEKSLGVFELEPEDQEEEPELSEKAGTRRERIGRYFGWHLRRQVAYDIWWLVCGIFLICIIERTKLMDDVNAPWFNLFRIVFELVSAFGGIGLSLGLPSNNYAFSGAFGPLSKLIVIIIMLRGRHRGLPVAIDRAILLPEDVVPQKEGNPDSKSQAQTVASIPEKDQAEDEKNVTV